MVVTPAIANLIREGKTAHIYEAIETCAQFGMIPMDRSLADLVNNRYIDKESALAKANKPDSLNNYLSRSGAGAEYERRSYAY